MMGFVRGRVEKLNNLAGDWKDAKFVVLPAAAVLSVSDRSILMRRDSSLPKRSCAWLWGASACRTGQEGWHIQQALSSQQEFIPGDAREEPGACLQIWGRSTANFSMHVIMLRSIKGRLKWKFCPLLLLLGCILVLHCPASSKLQQHDKKCSLVCLVSLDHYFSIRSMCSLVTMVPILQKQNKTKQKRQQSFSTLYEDGKNVCWTFYIFKIKDFKKWKMLPSAVVRMLHFINTFWFRSPLQDSIIKSICWALSYQGCHGYPGIIMVESY